MAKTNQGLTSSASAFYGWGTVLALLAAYAVSTIDRQVLTLLVAPVRHDLAITDTQIGILQGPAFGLFYAFGGLPLGWLADRTHRVRMIAIGIIVWSAMTMACGLATNFHELFFARMGVGIGEAALVPASVSLLADLFRPEKRALPLSIFTAGISLGAGLSLILGGVLVAFAAHGVEALPLVGAWLAAQHGWQSVFVMTGFLGLPVAAAVLMLSEPKRASTGDSQGHAKLAEGLAYLGAHRGLFAPLLAGLGVTFLFTNAYIAWNPTLFMREFGWTPMQVGAALGSIIGPCAIAGNLAGGLLTNWLAKRGRRDAPLLSMIIGTGAYVSLAILGPLSPTPQLALVGVAAIYFTMSILYGIATTTLVAVTPNRFRGQMVALYLLIGNLLGPGLGPVIAGAMLDHGFTGPSAIGRVLSTLGVLFMGPGFLLIWAAKRRYAQQAVVVGAGEVIPAPEPV